MGLVVDEETGEEPSCMYCGSKDDCPHLVAVIDRSFAECSGGVLFESLDNLREILSGSILAKLKAAEGFKAVAADDEIASIVQEAISNYDLKYPDDVYIDEYMLLAWLIEILLDVGATEPLGDIVEEGGPGQSSALTLLYAPDPKLVIREAEKVLQDAVARL